MGLSSTTDKQKEAGWRAEFEALGEQLVFRNVQRGAIYNDEAKRQAALRWLSERDRIAQLGWLAFFVAIAGGACQHRWLGGGARLSHPRRVAPPWTRGLTLSGLKVIAAAQIMHAIRKPTAA